MPLDLDVFDRTANQKINKLHKRALRIAYDDYCSSFEELLDKDGAVTIHQRNLRALAIEMYKISNGLSPTFMVEMIMMEISQILQKNRITDVTKQRHLDTD